MNETTAPAVGIIPASWYVYTPGVGGGRIPVDARRPLVWRAARAIVHASGRRAVRVGTPRAYRIHARIRAVFAPVARRYSPAMVNLRNRV